MSSPPIMSTGRQCGVREQVESEQNVANANFWQTCPLPNNKHAIRTKGAGYRNPPPIPQFVMGVSAPMIKRTDEERALLKLPPGPFTKRSARPKPKPKSRRQLAPDSDDEDMETPKHTPCNEDRPNPKHRVKQSKPQISQPTSYRNSTDQNRKTTSKSSQQDHVKSVTAAGTLSQSLNVNVNRDMLKIKQETPPTSTKLQQIVKDLYQTGDILDEKAPPSKRAVKPLKPFKFVPPHNPSKGQQSMAPNKVRNKRRKWKNRNLAQPQICTLLSKLPGEIRNEIYKYVIPQTRVLICQTKPEKERQAIQKTWQFEREHVKLGPSRLYCLIDSNQQRAGLDISFGLLGACRQTKLEVEEFLYSRTIFCFDSMNVIHKFLNTASKEGIKAIEHIEMHHESYGETQLTTNSVFKERHDLKWHKTCERLGRELASLKQVDLQIHLHEWPVKLNEDGHWHKALMQLVSNKGVHLARARVKHHMYADKKMAHVSRKLEESLMSDDGKHAQQVEWTRIVLKEAALRKAAEEDRLTKLDPSKECLRITLEDCKVMPTLTAKKPVQTQKVYTESAANWMWKYGTGNKLGTDADTYPY